MVHLLRATCHGYCGRRWPTRSTTTGRGAGGPRRRGTPLRRDGRRELATRSRIGVGAFGPVAQWITLAAAIVVIVVIAILVTNGGDFNPNDDLFGSGTAPAEFPPAGNPAISDL